MRALAKDPEQRYGSAEEMDADLARVARGVAVSRETEDAMTQVLSGAGRHDRADDGHAPARRRAAARAARLPHARPYYDYEEPPRGRSIWPWLLALGLIIAGAIGGWFLYTKIQDQLNANKPVAVPDVRAAAARPREAEDRAGRARRRRSSERAERARCRKGQVSDAEPRRRLEGRQGLDGHADGLDRQAEGAGARRASARTSTAAVAALAAARAEPEDRARSTRRAAGHRDGASSPPPATA